MGSSFRSAFDQMENAMAPKKPNMKKKNAPKPDNVTTTGKIKNVGLVERIAKKYKVPQADVKQAIKNAGRAEEDIVEWLRTEVGHKI